MCHWIVFNIMQFKRNKAEGDTKVLVLLKFYDKVAGYYIHKQRKCLGKNLIKFTLGLGNTKSAYF